MDDSIRQRLGLAQDVVEGIYDTSDQLIGLSYIPCAGSFFLYKRTGQMVPWLRLQIVIKHPTKEVETTGPFSSATLQKLTEMHRWLRDRDR